MADGADNLAGIPKLGDDFMRGGVGGEVEHRAVASDIEQRVVVFCLADELGQLLRVLPEMGLVLKECLADLVTLEGFDGGRIEGCFAAFWGGNSDFDAGILKDIVGVGEFGKVPAGRSVGIAQFVVGAQDEENLGCHAYRVWVGW